MCAAKLTSCFRTHSCGELRATDNGADVTLSGWVQRVRDHGGIIFVDLRDNYGLTQVLFGQELHAKISSVRVESVITVEGKVVPRAGDNRNDSLPTGAIEVRANTLKVQSQAEVLPFQVAEDDNAPEAARLKHRFVELRREKLHQNILLRSDVIAATREIMHDLGFREFQTPILTSSSPEGARDYLVPSRHYPGKFFALPQAPQQFKQLIMVAGFDRYFQIAPCFRDEDPRADRSPGEFYQLDIEMSFVEQGNVFEAGEAIFTPLFSRFAGCHVDSGPYQRIPYKEALEQFGSDKPDLRNSLRIEDVSEVFAASEFRVFQSALAEGGAVRAIAVQLAELPSRKYFDDTVAWFQDVSGQGLAYLAFKGEVTKGSIAKFVSESELAALRNRFVIDGSCVLFLAAGDDNSVLPAMGKLRSKLGIDHELLDQNTYRFCWIVDYPLYELDEETRKYDFSHNPFSMPQGGLEALETRDPLEVYAWQYDLVCNGYELVSGAIRNHDPEIMYKAFGITGYTREQVDNEFGGMIRAFKFGAPPHGGWAAGLDRIVMLLAGEEAIREVIMFPLAQTVEDLMMNAPNSVREEQLKELCIQFDLPEENKQ